MKRDIRNDIINAFKKAYGFAPAKKDLIPMEAYGHGTKSCWEYTWIAFCVGDVGYEYSVDTKEVTRSRAYDMMRDVERRYC